MIGVRHAHGVTLGLCLLLGTLPGPGAAQQPGPTSALEEARAAVEAAPWSADRWFNQGLLLAQAGQAGPAVLALEQAQLHAPWDRGVWDLRQRVQQEVRHQRAGQSSSRVLVGEPALVSSWRTVRVIPVWLLTASLTLACWMIGGGGLWFRRARPGTRSLPATVAAVGVLLALSSAGWLGARRMLDRWADPAVVVASRPVWREAPDELSMTREHPGLHPGSIVRLRERRQPWCRVELADGQQVWMREYDVTPILAGPGSRPGYQP
jgi:hypothetical protein